MFMFKNLFFFLTIGLTVSCVSNKCVIEGNISGLEGEGWVYLQDAWNGWQIIDSTKAVDGSFRFEIDKPVATNAYMYYNNRIQLHNLLLEPGTIIAKGDIDNAWNTPTYGTPMNDRLKSTVESIMYMDTDSMTMDEIKTIKTKAVREELNTGKGDAYRLYMISSVMDVLSPTELMKYLETLDEELRNCPFSQETKDLLTRLAYVYPYEDGSEIIPSYIDIDFQDQKGHNIRLNSVVSNPDNRYVLIDFWATWCKPCREELPAMKNIYDTYHSKGLEIYGVSIDSNIDQWRNYIAENDIKWINVYSGEDQKIAETYAITAIPTNILIDCKTGIIVGRSLGTDELTEKLASLLRS